MERDETLSGSAGVMGKFGNTSGWCMGAKLDSSAALESSAVKGIDIFTCGVEILQTIEMVHTCL